MWIIKFQVRLRGPGGHVAQSFKRQSSTEWGSTLIVRILVGFHTVEHEVSRAALDSREGNWPLLFPLPGPFTPTFFSVAWRNTTPLPTSSHAFKSQVTCHLVIHNASWFSLLIIELYFFPFVYFSTPASAFHTFKTLPYPNSHSIRLVSLCLALLLDQRPTWKKKEKGLMHTDLAFNLDIITWVGVLKSSSLKKNTILLSGDSYTVWNTRNHKE